MRKYIDIVNSDDFITFSIMNLNESIINEGIFDQINSMISKVKTKYGDIKYEFLAQSTVKALNFFQNKSPETTQLINRIGRVAKFAVNNRALLSVLIGILGTLVSLASHPTALAQMVSKLDHVFSGNDLDEIIKQLHQSGINVAALDTHLSPEITGMARKAAQALHAIEQYQYSHGQNIETKRELFNHLTVVGDITKENSTVTEHIILKTADGKITLSELKSIVNIENGKVSVDEQESGVKVQLYKYLDNLPDDQKQTVSHYIEDQIGEKEEKGLTDFLQHNSNDILSLVASLIQFKPDGRYRIKFNSQGLGAKRI